MEILDIKNLGPIRNASVEFGNFTIFVGPQASGKSIFLQMIKLLADKEYIAGLLNKHGYAWTSHEDFLELYFGEGMSHIWQNNTVITKDDVEVTKSSLPTASSVQSLAEQVYYVPAQRVLCLQNGWPKPFSDYSNDPFVLKNFSEHLRFFMDYGPAKLLMPNENSRIIRDDMYRNVFYDAEMEMDISGLRKRVVLRLNNNKVPYMGWSAGQKEFTPLWLSMYMYRHPQYRVDGRNMTIVFEEPEMGLHPKAIEMIIIELLWLLNDGYRVIVSTHSPVFLEFAWAIQLLQKYNASASALQDLFHVARDQKTEDFDKILNNTLFKTYYFSHGEEGVRDISSLDPTSDDLKIAEWGGLSSFASRAAEIVAKNIPL